MREPWSRAWGHSPHQLGAVMGLGTVIFIPSVTSLYASFSQAVTLTERAGVTILEGRVLLP